MARDIDGARARARAPDRAVRARLPDAVRARVLRLENGPPVGFPVQFRVSGEDIADRARASPRKVADVMRANPDAARTSTSTGTSRARSSGSSIDQDRARVLGVSSQDLANFLQSSLSGTRVSLYREGDELIEILLRGPDEERAQLSLLESLAVPTATGRSVPLAQIATRRRTASRTASSGGATACRRSRCAPTSTARCSRRPWPRRSSRRWTPMRAALPPGYLLEIGGTVEDSGRGQNSVAAGMPLFLVVVMTLLMMQLQSFARVLLVLLTAPLGLIGVVAVPAAVQRAVRLRRHAGHDRAVGHDHAQLGDPGRPDRAGHRRRPHALAGDRRLRPCAASARSC